MVAVKIPLVSCILHLTFSVCALKIEGVYSNLFLAVVNLVHMPRHSQVFNLLPLQQQMAESHCPCHSVAVTVSLPKNGWIHSSKSGGGGGATLNCFSVLHGGKKNTPNMTLSCPCCLAFSWLHQYVLHYPRKSGLGRIHSDVSAAVAVRLN